MHGAIDHRKSYSTEPVSSSTAPPQTECPAARCTIAKGGSAVANVDETKLSTARETENSFFTRILHHPRNRSWPLRVYSRSIEPDTVDGPGQPCLFDFEGVVRPANLNVPAWYRRFRCTRHSGSHLSLLHTLTTTQGLTFPYILVPAPGLARAMDVTALAATGKTPVRFNISAFRSSTIIPHKRILTCVWERHGCRYHLGTSMSLFLSPEAVCFC